MVNFNEYISAIDFTEIRRLFLAKGNLVELRKKDYFVRQNELCNNIGFIESGLFRYTRIGSEGKERSVGFSFADDFVCDYASLIQNAKSLVNAQAITNTTIYVLSIHDLNDYWETNIETQRFGRLSAEQLFVEMYQRLLNFYCDTAEERYIALLQRCPLLFQYITLKEIASFLGVTPETVSHIRKKLHHK